MHLALGQACERLGLQLDERVRLVDRQEDVADGAGQPHGVAEHPRVRRPPVRTSARHPCDRPTRRPTPRRSRGRSALRCRLRLPARAPASPVRPRRWHPRSEHRRTPDSPPSRTSGLPRSRPPARAASTRWNASSSRWASITPAYRRSSASPTLRCNKARRADESSSSTTVRSTACRNWNRSPPFESSSTMPLRAASLERFDQRLAVGVDHVLDDRKVERRPDDRRDLQRVVRELGQPIEPRPDDLLRSLGKIESPQPAARHSPLCPDQRTGLRQVPKHLAEEQRVAAGLGVQRADESAPMRRRLTGRGVDELGDFARVESVQRQSLHTRLPPQVRRAATTTDGVRSRSVSR